MFKMGKNPTVIKSLSGSQGLTILEVLAAVAILSFGILAVATMQASSIKGNAQAIGITDAITLAQDKVEYLMTLAYSHADLSDTDNDGTDEDADDDGDDDDGGNFGLDDTVDGVGNVIADRSEASGRYTLYWNIAVDESIVNVKTVRILVVWSERVTERRAVMDVMKSEII